MAKPAIKSARRRKAHYSGMQKASMYDAMMQEQMGKMAVENIYDEENQKQRNIAALGEVVNFMDARREQKERMREVEQGVAIAEEKAKGKAVYDKVTLMDVFEGKNKLSEVGMESWQIGKHRYSAADMRALAQTYQTNKMQQFITGESDQVPVMPKGSGWTYKAGETQPILGTGYYGVKAAKVLREEDAYKAGQIIYQADRSAKSYGLDKWSSKSEVVDKLIKDKFSQDSANYDADLTAMVGLTDAEKTEFTETYAEYKDLVSIKKNARTKEQKARIKEIQQFMKPYYNKISDNMAWEDVAPYIRTAESGDKEMIIRENEAGLGFDLGPYQINTRWLFAGEGTFQKMAGTDALYKPWEEIDKLLMGDLSQEQMQLLPLGTTTYTGKKQGFDLGDMVGKNSIWQRYKDRDTINPFVEEYSEEQELLTKAGIVDENLQLWDTQADTSQVYIMEDEVE